MIATNSRYIKDLVVRVQDAAGVWNLAIYHEAVNDQRLSFTYYSWQQGDNLTNIAFYIYADPQQWWIIANANPEILYWDDLPLGTVIRLPTGNLVG